MAGRTEEPRGPTTPHSATEKRTRIESLLLALPDELVERICQLHASVDTLCSLACTHPRLRSFVEGPHPWRELYASHFGQVTEVTELAAELAGGWKALFAAKAVAVRTAAPWERPCSFEVEAAVQHMAGLLPGGAAAAKQRPAPQGGNTEGGGELCVVFLVDGSGSVTEEDFAVMQSFLTSAASLLGSSILPRIQSESEGQGDGLDAPTPRIAVVQFSNDTRVERALGPAPAPGGEPSREFEALVANMRRMNGGTNIAAAVQKAGQLLKPIGRRARRVLALLTDGRVDSYQAREACEMAQRMADEQGNVSLYAFGVGRGVDKAELLRIVSSTCPLAMASGSSAYSSPAAGPGARVSRWGIPGASSSQAEAGPSSAAAIAAAAAASKEVESRYLGLCVLDEAPW